MKGLTKKFLSFIITLSMVFTMNISAFAADSNAANIDRLVKAAEKEIADKGEASTDTVNELASALKKIGVETGSYSGTHQVYGNVPTNRGYGQTHQLGRGWTYRVDKASAGAAKPHVHVDNKRLNVHAVENVDGTSSHKKSLDDCKVPKDIQEKVKGSRDYKKGQEDLKNMQKAKQEINRRHLNMKNRKDVIIAAGIFVTIVGVAFFAPEALPAALLLI